MNKNIFFSDPNYIIFIIIGVFSFILICTLLTKFNEKSPLSFITISFLITTLINAVSFTLNWSSEENNERKPYYGNSMCWLQGFLKTFSTISLFFWWLTLEITQYLVMIKGVSVTKISNTKCKIIFYTIFTVLPLAFCLSLVKSEAYVFLFINCSVNDKYQIIINFLRAICAVSLIVITVLYVKAWCNLRNDIDNKLRIGIWKNVLISLVQMIKFGVISCYYYVEKNYTFTIIFLYSEIWQGILYPLIILWHDIIIIYGIKRLLHKVEGQDNGVHLMDDIEENGTQILEDYFAENLIEEANTPMGDDW